MRWTDDEEEGERRLREIWDDVDEVERERETRGPGTRESERERNRGMRGSDGVRARGKMRISGERLTRRMLWNVSSGREAWR